MNAQTIERAAWIAGAVGAVASALGWALTPHEFAYAWLAAVAFWLPWPLGCMGLILTHALTGGRWGQALRPALLAGMSTLPLILLLCIPVLVALPTLYPWARDGVVLANRFYLNVPLFAVRGVIYLTAWFALGALILRAMSRGAASLARLAAPGLIVLAITLNFAAIDLTMSLDPRFNSSVYGYIAIAQAGLFALSVAALLEAPTSRSTGKMLLGLVMLWAYLDFMQILIVWQSDLATEAPWYVARSTGLWGAVGLLVAATHFLLPFLALLSPRVQSARAGVRTVAAMLVGSEVLRAWWLVLPARGGFAWVDVAAMVAVGGVALGATLRAPRLLRRSVPRHA
jgi:hypothetical protein